MLRLHLMSRFPNLFDFLFSLLLLAVVIVLATPAHAAETSIVRDLWSVIEPIVVLLVGAVGPFLVAWVAAKLVALLGVSSENQKAELERKIREALHQSALNGLKLALTRAGLKAGEPVTSAIVQEAIDYINDKNPGAVERFGLDDERLGEIVLSKVPDLLGRLLPAPRG